MSPLRHAALALLAIAGARSAAAQPPPLEGVPRYAHVFVILEENKSFDQILSAASAPNIAGLAKTYGVATRFYGETHPSEGNYVALLGGGNNGIHDDDAWWCKAGPVSPECPHANQPDYPNHTLATAHLGDQLQAAGLTWKAYLESLPEPGSLAYTAPDVRVTPSRTQPVYAAKHSGFPNFQSAQNDPDRKRHLVGFDQLQADLASGKLPNFALVVPNQCNEMHGLFGADAPPDCQITNLGPLIGRGDKEVGRLVDEIRKTAAWKSRDNVAIVVTFDEGVPQDRSGCCGSPPEKAGGRIPTLVITNHGPRGVSDDTPYNHYSLLRTLESAFGITDHLGHAGDDGEGVKPMTPLFRAP